MDEGLVLDIDVKRRLVGDEVSGDERLRLLVLEKRGPCIGK